MLTSFSAITNNNQTFYLHFLRSIARAISYCLQYSSDIAHWHSLVLVPLQDLKSDEYQEYVEIWGTLGDVCLECAVQVPSTAYLDCYPLEDMLFSNATTKRNQLLATSNLTIRCTRPNQDSRQDWTPKTGRDTQGLNVKHRCNSGFLETDRLTMFASDT